MIERITDATLAEFEAFNQSHPKGNFAQSSYWAKQKPMWKWEAVACRGDDGKIRGTISMLIRKAIPALPYTIVYSCRGPVCDIHDHETIAELIEGARQIARENKAYVFKIDPDVPSSETEFSDYLHELGFVSREGGKGFDALQPRYVFRLELNSRSED